MIFDLYQLKAEFSQILATDNSQRSQLCHTSRRLLVVLSPLLSTRFGPVQRVVQILLSSRRKLRRFALLYRHFDPRSLFSSRYFLNTSFILVIVRSILRLFFFFFFTVLCGFSQPSDLSGFF